MHSAFGLLTNLTMVVFGKTRWALLGKQFADAANLALAALVFGQFISQRQFSVAVLLSGIVLWLGLVAAALVVAGRETP